MLADLAMRAGERVVAFDLFGDLDLRRERRAGRHGADADRARRRRGRRSRAQRVVYGASFENHPVLVARLAERHALLGNPPETLRAVRDPHRLAAVLARRGSVPAHARHPARRPLGPLAAQAAARRRRHARARLARRQAARGHDRAGAHRRHGVLGRRGGRRARRGRARASPSSSSGERAFGVRGYRWCGNVVPPRLPADERDACDQARAICSCLAAAFGLRGLFGVDFVWDGERAWTLEVNPRPTASLEAIEAAYGVDVFAAHLQGCAGRLPDAGARRGAAGKAVVFATEDIVVGDSERWLEHGVRDVPHPGERIAAGRPICTVLASAATPEDALRAARGAGRGLRWSAAHV